jgi:hypothetical protein
VGQRAQDMAEGKCTKCRFFFEMLVFYAIFWALRVPGPLWDLVAYHISHICRISYVCPNVGGLFGALKM